MVLTIWNSVALVSEHVGTPRHLLHVTARAFPEPPTVPLPFLGILPPVLILLHVPSGSSGSPEPSPPTAPSALVTFPLGRSGGGNLLVSSAAKVSSASVGGRHLALRGSFMASASGIFKSR